MWEVPLEIGGVARARLSTTSEGDFAAGVDLSDLERSRAALVPLPWVWLDQVHGAGVVTVTGHDDLQASRGRPGDAVVVAVPGVVVSVRAADCAPIALVSPQGAAAAVHAGWRGLEAGVIEAAADVMRGLGARQVLGALFSCIGPECYEFGHADLDRLERRLGSSVVGQTSQGAPALDVPAAVGVAMARAGVEQVAVEWGCTACDEQRRWYSHRARAEVGRHALAVWMAPIT